MKKRFIFIAVSSVVLIIFLYTFTHGSFAAEAADNILRPVLGEKSTLTLESWYFSFGDSVKHLVYNVKKPDANIFTTSRTQTNSPHSTSTISSLDLNHISLPSFLSPLPGEGVWQPIQQSFYPSEPVLAKTFVRPDPNRQYAIVSLVQIATQKLALGVEAGTYYPGGLRKVYGPGYVPKTIQKENKLLAVFNGGFMERDGHYGMIVGNKTYVPLRKGLATLVINSHGSAQMIDYEGQTLAPDAVAVRQNGAFLIKNGSITPFTENGLDTWGRTTTNSMYTWRSGIGITKTGNLVYAVGNSLVPETLAKALLSAGTVNAMQLDINPYWVRFIIYNQLGNGNYSYYPLLKDMQNGGYAYLHGYNKDFFYIYKKA